MPFDGFPEDAVRFFKQLKNRKNNNLEWYQTNKERYRSILVEPAASLALDLRAAGLARKYQLDVNPRSVFYRLHRDVRFSADKTPLKTASGASWSRSGLKKDQGHLYFNFDPVEFYLAAGFWMPDPALLRRFRLAMVEDPAAFKRMRAGLARAKLELWNEESLTRLPRGFESYAGTPIAETLKLKHLLVFESLGEADVRSKRLTAKILAFAKRSKPLLDWGWSFVDQWRREGGDEDYQARLTGKKRDSII